MARKKNVLNSPTSLLGTVLMAVIIVPAVVLPFVEALGGVDEIIIDLIDLLPFGQAFYEIAIIIVNGMLDQVVSFHGLQGVFTLSYVVQELAEGIFTVIIYEALRLAVLMVMGLADPENRGRWNGMKKIVVSVAVAVIAACLAPALISWTFGNMSSLASGWKVFVSSLISVILLGGGVAFFVFLSGLAIGQSIIYVALKFFLVGAIRLAGSYIFLMLLLLAWQSGIWSLFTGALSSFLLIMVLMALVEMLLESIFDM